MRPSETRCRSGGSVSLQKVLYSSLPASLDIGTFVTPTEQKIVDLEKGERTLGCGEVGEIIVRNSEAEVPNEITHRRSFPRSIEIAVEGRARLVLRRS